MASTVALESPTPPTDATSSNLARAEEIARDLSDDELRLFGAWLARYASERLEKPIVFSFRSLTDTESDYGRHLAKELNVETP